MFEGSKEIHLGSEEINSFTTDNVKGDFATSNNKNDDHHSRNQPLNIDMKINSNNDKMENHIISENNEKDINKTEALKMVEDEVDPLSQEINEPYNSTNDHIWLDYDHPSTPTTSNKISNLTNRLKNLMPSTLSSYQVKTQHPYAYTYGNLRTSNQNSVGNRVMPYFSSVKGPHIFLWTILCFPISFLITFLFSLYYSSLTLYNFYDYYFGDRRHALYRLNTPFKIALLTLLLLFSPIFAVLCGIFSGLYVAVTQLTCDFDVWRNEICDFEKGFYGWLCTVTNLPHCCPYDVALARETRMIKQGTKSAKIGGSNNAERVNVSTIGSDERRRHLQFDYGNIRNKGTGLSMMPTNNAHEIINHSNGDKV
ncbi:unnamed protein product [Gordionus sp. m RMFG-2023]|uniref:uncharacterized protein LOC135930417 n=1 Tax=Gordionus sp. m RMFG-2023 TaxID=3053472 RepID=UPI0030E34080